MRKLQLGIFLWGFLLVSCSPEVIESDYFLLSEKASSLEDRARYLFLGAQASFHLAETLKDSQNDAALERTRGALLRVIELGVGPIEEARHNLRILFKDDPDTLENSPAKDNQMDQSKDQDLSDQVQEMSEEERRIEELLQKDLSNRPPKGESVSPVPLQEDF